MSKSIDKKKGPLARLMSRRDARKKPLEIPRGEDLTTSAGGDSRASDDAPRMTLGPGNMRAETVAARVKAAEAVSAAICRAAASPAAGEVVRLQVCKRRPGDGAPRPAGAVEGLALKPNLARHAYAHAFRCLEQAGLAACEWNDVDGARMPLSVSFKAVDAARIAIFLAVDGERAKRNAGEKPAHSPAKGRGNEACRKGAPTSAAPAEAEAEVPAAARYDERSGSPSVSAEKAGERRAAGRQIAEAFATLSALYPTAAVLELRVFDPPEQKRSRKCKESGLPDLRKLGKKRLGYWNHPFAEAEAAGLVRLEWAKLRGRPLPSSAFAASADVEAIEEFFGVPAATCCPGSAEKARATTRADNEGKACGDVGTPLNSSGPQAAKHSAASPEPSPQAQKAAGKERLRAEALADAGLLLDAAEAVGTGPLAMYLATAADDLARCGRATAPAVEKARTGGRLGDLLAVVSRYPSPLSSPVELRVASSAALGSSKALDGALGLLLARLLEESGAAPEGPGDALSRWGFAKTGPRMWIGGDALLQCADGPDLDLKPLGAEWCAPCSALARASSVDPRGCRAVVAMENLAAWRQAVRDLGSLALFVYADGWMCGSREESLAALMSLLPEGFPLLAWNDADTCGFQRFDSLSRDFPAAEPVLMDCETLAAMRDAQLREMDKNQRKVLELYLADHPASRFAPVGRALLRRGRFLEQEALLDGYAQEVLGGMLRVLPCAERRGNAQHGPAAGLEKGE